MILFVQDCQGKATPVNRKLSTELNTTHESLNPIANAFQSLERTIQESMQSVATNIQSLREASGSNFQNFSTKCDQILTLLTARSRTPAVATPQNQLVLSPLSVQPTLPASVLSSAAVEYSEDWYDSICAHRIAPEGDVCINISDLDVAAYRNDWLCQKPLDTARKTELLKKRKKNRRNRIRNPTPLSRSQNSKHQVHFYLQIAGKHFKKSRLLARAPARTVTKSGVRSRNLRPPTPTSRRSETPTLSYAPIHALDVMTSRICRNFRSVQWFQLRNLEIANRTGSAQGGPSLFSVFPGCH